MWSRLKFALSGGVLIGLMMLGGSACSKGLEDRLRSDCEKSYLIAREFERRGAQNSDRFSIQFEEEQYIRECQVIVAGMLRPCLSQGSRADACEKDFKTTALARFTGEACVRTAPGAPSRDKCRREVDNIDRDLAELRRKYDAEAPMGTAPEDSSVESATGHKNYLDWVGAQAEQLAATAKPMLVIQEAGRDSALFLDARWVAGAVNAGVAAERSAKEYVRACRERKPPADRADGHERLCRAWELVVEIAVAEQAALKDQDLAKMGRVEGLAREATALMRGVP